MTVFYIDVSHYDWDRNKGNLDWAQIKANGIDIVFIRSTYGDPQTYNPETRYFNELATGAKNAGLMIGGYHNLIRGDLSSIKRQVTYFLETLDSVNAEFAMLDIEPYPSLITNGLWPRLSDAEIFAQEFRNLDNTRSLGIYLPKWVWSGYLNRPDLRPLIEQSQGPLVSSNYPMGSTKDNYMKLYDLSKGDNGPGWEAYGLVTPSIWQYSSSSSVPGASSVTDINAFKGTSFELQTKLGRNDAMAWVLTKNLQALRTQFNEAFPNRSKTSDGTIGDQAHASGTSGHNPDITGQAEYRDYDLKDEVRAIDIDKDLNDPDVTMEDVIQHLLKLARAGKLSVIRYMIYNKRIWSSSNGWAQQVYTGTNQHTEHAHFSGAYTQSADENASFNYQLDELVDPFMSISQTDFNKLFLGAVNDPDVAFQLRARPWQYAGGGLPPGMSSLNTFYSIWTMLDAQNKAIAALGKAIADESTNPEELRAALDNLPTADETANAVVNSLGAQTTDDLVATLKSILTEQQINDLKASL